LTQEYLTKNGITVLSQPPYSPDLAPAGYCLSSRMKALLKGWSLQSERDENVTMAAQGDKRKRPSGVLPAWYGQ
jgi:transposase